MTVSASVRIVVDLADDEKVLAVLPGGVTGRRLHPHYTDQIEAYMEGDEVYWWFGEQAVEDHARSRLELVPESL